MTIVLPADMTDTHEEERGTFNFRRASLMFESRTPTLVTYSFIPDSDCGLIQWLSDVAELADPRLFVHWGFDGIELSTAPDGTILDQDYYAFDRSVSATSRDGVKMETYGIGWEVLPSNTENETGRHAAILMTIHSLDGEFNFLGAKAELTLNGLYRDNWGEELVVPGRWSCTFTLPETDPGRLCTVNEPVEIEGKNAVLTTLYVSPLSLTCEIKQGTDDLKETVEPIYSDEGKESIAPEVTLQSGETVGAADWLFLITNYADKRGRYCFRMDEILDLETVSSVSVFGETFSVES